MAKFLMVCLGNICRSPLAEGILQSKLPHHLIDSAGTSAHHQGEAPDSRSIKIAQQHGIDISKQKSRPFTPSDFDTFDFIYVMDTSNYKNVMKLARTECDKQKIKLILDEISPEGMEVPDPYYGGENGFKAVYNMLDEATDVIAHRF